MLLLLVLPVLLVVPLALLTLVYSQTVDGVQRLKMTAVVSPSGGTYGINLQATQFCGPKAAVPCSSAPVPADDVKVEPSPMRTTAQNPTSTTLVLEEHDRSGSSDPDYPLGKTAAAIWIDTNIPLSTNASRAGYASFDVSAPSSPFTPLAARLFAQLVGNASYMTGVSFYNITQPNQFKPLDPAERNASLDTKAFADNNCSGTVLFLVNDEASEKVMDGAKTGLYYLHRKIWVLTAQPGSASVLLNGKPAPAPTTAGPLPSVSGHEGRGFGLFIAPPHSLSVLWLGLIPNCRRCVPVPGTNMSCVA